MSMAMDKGEKPTRVEVGMRFAVGKETCTITELLDGGESAGMHWDAPLDFLGLESCAYILKNYVYLGAPSPSSPGRPVMEANPNGDPARCFVCGGDKGERIYSCDACCGKPDYRTWNKWTEEWHAGARDFPRPRSSQGEPVAVVGPVVASKPAEFKPIGIDWGVGVPVKREVYAGGAWLDYERLADPDPFTAYKRRRENGVEVKALGANACGLCEEIAPLGYDGHCADCSATEDDARYRGRMDGQVRLAPAPAVGQRWASSDVVWTTLRPSDTGAGWWHVKSDDGREREAGPTWFTNPNTRFLGGPGPLSALGAVPSRQPPEPWRPSVTEEDLLPDAGTSWSYSKPSSPGGGE